MDNTNQSPPKGFWVQFGSKRHIDKIQISVKSCHRHEIIERLSSIAHKQPRQDHQHDRRLTLFRSDALIADVCEYDASKDVSSAKKIWSSVRVYDPTDESQELLISNIFRNVPTEDRFTKCIEFALDFYPIESVNLPAMHRFITRHLTLKNSHSIIARKNENSFTLNPDNRKNIQVITYLNPKEAGPKSLRIELRLYRDHIARRYPQYASFDSPIKEFVSPLDESYIVFRDPLINHPLPHKDKEFKAASTLRRKASLGLMLQHLKTIQNEEFVQNQIAMFRHLANSMNVKHRDINRYFPKRPDITQQLCQGNLRIEGASPSQVILVH